MTQTITDTYTSGITLTDPDTTIAAAARVTEGSGYAVTGPSAGVLLNEGTVQGGAVGIYLASGSTLTNASTGLVSGYFGVQIAGDGSVSNAGSVVGTGSFRAAVQIEGVGTISNELGGVISGDYGARIVGGAGSIANDGTIIGSAAYGARFGGDGTLTNGVDALIEGANGGVLIPVAGVVMNQGTILGDVYYGVRASEGTVTNFSTGVIAAATTGVFLEDHGVLRNEGTIRATNTAGSGPAVLLAGGASTVVNLGVIGNAGSGLAVDFQGSTSNRLEIGSAARFEGGVRAAGSSNQIGLLAGGGSGTLAGVGTSFAGFNSIFIEAGADWTIGGTLFNELIFGFDNTDKLNLAGVVADSVSFASNQLSVYEAGTLLGTTLLFGSFSSSDFFLRSDGAGGTDIVLPDVFAGTYTDGLRLTADTSTLTGAGLVTSPGYGVFSIESAVRRTLVNEGTVTADGPGVYLAGGGVLDNRGAVTGTVGLVGEAGPTTLLNSGILVGTGSIGAYLAGGGRVTNSASGTIKGAVAIAVGSGGTVQNDGLIESTASVIGTGVFLTRGGLVTNGADGVITGYSSGIAVAGPGTVVNDGTIEATGSHGTAVTLADRGTVTNTLYGVIQGGIGVAATYGATVFNEGYILSNQPDGVAVFLQGGSYLSSCNCGVITGDTGVLLVEGTVVNEGAIAGFVRDGVVLAYGGTVMNAASASIFGAVSGIDSIYGPLSLLNDGMIEGSVQGVLLGYGGTVTNQADGVITGLTGILAEYEAATVVNAGSIGGDAMGFGVDLQAGGTVTNSGTISGGVAAVRFDGTAANRLILQPGATFLGAVVAQGSGASTLELASSASVGTITGIGTSFTGFGSIVVDAGAQWSLTGTNSLSAGVTLSGSGLLAIGGTLDTTAAVVAFNGAVTGSGTVGIGAGSRVGLGGSVAAAQHIVFGAGNGTLGIGAAGSFGATVFGFGAGDAIDFTGITGGAGISTSLAAGNRLTLKDGATLLASIQLDPTQDYSGLYFHAASDGSGGTVVTEDATPCFLRGTAIAVPGGQRSVETLRSGDLVQTLSGAARPVRWIGRGRTRITARNRCSMGPVTIRAGALAAGVPRRDLHVTRDHAVLLGDVLVPVEHLVNGITVVWDDRARLVEYYHVELDAHDVLLAEGAPLESFRDADSSMLFDNAATRLVRAAPPCRPPPCRPIIASGLPVQHAWRAVARRAGLLPPQRLGADADLHLLVAGRRIDPVAVEGETERFRVPAPAGDVVIASRTLVPAAHSLGTDRRRLGVAIMAIVLHHTGGRRDVPLAGLSDGFHADEGIRWTRGAGILPAALFAGLLGPVEIELVLATRRTYPSDVEPFPVALAA